MKMPAFFGRLLATLAITVSLTACAVNPATANCPDNERVHQSFSFGYYGENPDIEILNVYYGIPNCPANYDSQYKGSQYNGKPMQSTNIVGGPFRRAWKLDIKWRIKSTGQEYEENIDLRSRLPKDMSGHRLHFTIEGPQLYVYLITPERRPPDFPEAGPKPYRSLKTLIIFPDQTK